MYKASDLTIQLKEESFDSLQPEWLELLNKTVDGDVFQSPQWLRTWWDCFGKGASLKLFSIRSGSELIGILPMMQRGSTLSFIADPDVCDFHDAIVSGPQCAEALTHLVKTCLSSGITTIELSGLRPDSFILSNIPPVAEALGLTTESAHEDTSPWISPLTDSWDAYLNQLSGKDRHELKRKMRRLDASGLSPKYYSVDKISAQSNEMDDFLKLMALSREEKHGFLTQEREHFFRTLIENLSKAGIVKIFFLDLESKRVSACICFDYKNVYALYNSGFDPAYANLSVGLLLKAYSIQDAIANKRKAFDFLRGSEDYKYNLGAKDVPLTKLILRK